MAKQVRTAYGTALFAAACDSGRLTLVREQAEICAAAISDNPEFIKILCHPEVSIEEKEGMVSAVFGEHVDPLITGTVAALLDKGHGKDIGSVLSYFIDRALEEEGIGVASVVSAIELNPEQKERIKQKLLGTTEYTSMRISFEVDRSLIGGMVIRLKDRVVDSSLKTQLSRMKSSLMHGE